jgi:ribosomal protein S9
VVRQVVSNKQQRKVVQLSPKFRLIKSRPEVTLTTIKRYFQFDQEHINEVESPLKFFQTKYDIFVKVSGGGKKGQSRAIKLAISRAIVVYYQEIDKRRGRTQERSGGKAVKYRRHLKHLGYLTQDSRSKERKKYGLLKARKAPQFSKR